MPLLHLQIKADLENIETLVPCEGVCWKFEVENEASERKTITCSSVEEEELEGSRGTANFVMRWAKGAQQSYIKIVPVKKVDGTYTAKDSGTWKTIVGLECRGLTVKKVIITTDFNAISTGGTTFEQIDLTDNDWTDYDDQNGNDVSVSVMSFESKIES